MTLIACESNLYLKNIQKILNHIGINLILCMSIYMRFDNMHNFYVIYLNYGYYDKKLNLI